MTIGEFIAAIPANWKSLATLALLVLVAHRMGRRGLWAIVPMVALIAGLALWYVAYGQTYNPADRGFESAMVKTYYSLAFGIPILGLMFVLAGMGPSRKIDIQGSVA